MRDRRLLLSAGTTAAARIPLVLERCLRQHVGQRQTTVGDPSGRYSRDKRHPVTGLALDMVVNPLPRSGEAAWHSVQTGRCMR